MAVAVDNALPDIDDVNTDNIIFGYDTFMIEQALLEQAGSVAKDAARIAGQAILPYRQGTTVTAKSETEIVTAADINADRVITQYLQAEFPDIPVYSEEGHQAAGSTRWIVDPLDGTTPWVYGNSGFAVSIALQYDGEIVLGVVFDPIMDELFFADTSHASTRNDEIIQPISVDSADALLVVDWGNEQEKRMEGVKYLQRLLLPDMFARRIVPQFAPALGLCRIAEGRIHGLICNDTWLEDHAAGAFILQQAGGYCTNFYHRSVFDVLQPGIIATSDQQLHGNICQRLS